LIRVVCIHCESNFDFNPVLQSNAIYDPESGGWAVQKGEIEGVILGRGACKKCGAIKNNIDWPADAYFSVEVPEGIVWAWNQDYVPILLARVVGNRVLLRQLTMYNLHLTNFVDRLPKYALLKKNRIHIERRMKRLLDAA